VPAVITDLDLANIARARAVNYLHLGDALDLLSELFETGASDPGDGPLAQLSCQRARSSELSVLLRSYIREKKKIRLSDLRSQLREAMEWRNRFRALGCRGFSYALDLHMRGYNSQRARRHQLARSVDLRMALMAQEQLFYPPRVRRYLRHVPWLRNHYHNEKTPAIALCFGRRAETAWYVLVMQSDPASHGPASVREHFRGWRHVLFANVVAQAYGRVPDLYLARAYDVERGCYPDTKQAGEIPESWKVIYDRTAEEWGMTLVQVAEPIDVQIYRGRCPVYATSFYKLPLSERLESALSREENLCTEHL